MRIACVDVQYEDPGPGALAAALAFDDWSAAAPSAETTLPIPSVAPYVPGSFYQRELPCILAVLGALPRFPEIVVVDGHVWLGPDRPGLGRRLLEAEPRLRTVVGVAKTRFRDAPATPLLRGQSAVPLWVDEAGDPVDAVRRIAEMHGSHRVPTLLRRVDQLARGLARTS